MDEGCEPVTEARGGFAGPSGRGGGYAGGYGGGGRRPLRVQSPPCYRNIFAEEDAEEAYAPWKARRPAPQAMSRYRCGVVEEYLHGREACQALGAKVCILLLPLCPAEHTARCPEPSSILPPPAGPFAAKQA